MSDSGGPRSTVATRNLAESPTSLLRSRPDAWARIGADRAQLEVPYRGDGDMSVVAKHGGPEAPIIERILGGHNERVGKIQVYSLVGAYLNEERWAEFEARRAAAPRLASVRSNELDQCARGQISGSGDGQTRDGGLYFLSKAA
jgi:hypothetical protein